jgi:hypothetical protein
LIQSAGDSCSISFHTCASPHARRTRLRPPCWPLQCTAPLTRRPRTTGKWMRPRHSPSSPALRSQSTRASLSSQRPGHLLPLPPTFPPPFPPPTLPPPSTPSAAPFHRPPLPSPPHPLPAPRRLPPLFPPLFPPHRPPLLHPQKGSRRLVLPRVQLVRRRSPPLDSRLHRCLLSVNSRGRSLRPNPRTIGGTKRGRGMERTRRRRTAVTRMWRR